MKIFEGVFTALVTPFSNGSVDYDTFEKLVTRQIEQGIHGLVPLGSTGEAATLTMAEREEILKITVRLADGKLPVIAGVGTNNTATTIENTRQAKDLGADAAMLMAPPYSKPSQEGIFAHFEAVAKAVDIPLVAYNVPGRTVANILPATVKRLSDAGLIVALKEASGDLMQVSEIMRTVGDKISVLSGDDFFLYSYMGLGVKGLISVCSNLLPRRTAEVYERFIAKDWKASREIQFELFPVMQALFIETNPTPVKAALSMLDLCKPEMRLPLVEMAEENLEALRDVLKDKQIIK